MGADSWTEITSWRDWERLLPLANHIVVTRPGYEFSAGMLAAEMAAQVIDMRGQNETIVSRMVAPGMPKIFVTDAVMRDVSATAVRQAVREDLVDDLSRLIPPDVAKYISKYRLYRNKNDE